jgi:hypothetical protein
LKSQEQVIRIYRVLGRKDAGPGEGHDEEHVVETTEGKAARVAGVPPP